MGIGDERTLPADAVAAQSIRGRFQRALAGEPIDWPVYAVYDWFVQHRAIDWPSLFAQGLGQINHANLIETKRPNLQIVETTCQTERGTRRDVRWITDRGELHEWYLGEWRQEYLIKSPEDYRIVQRALEGSQFTATDQLFLRSEAALGDGGITVGQLWRTPLMETQIDLAGLERCSLDLADEHPALMDLLELMADLVLQQFREAVKTPAKYIKLWENLSIETIGRRHYRRHLIPLYHKVLEILEAADKQLLVHYDGKLRLISEDIAALRIDGIDSLTPSPEGDMSVAEARALWPDKFLWLHPSLGWYRENPAVLTDRIRRMIDDAGTTRFCLMISEDVPPDWEQTVPVVLRACRSGACKGE
jgi:hypothetical protein